MKLYLLHTSSSNIFVKIQINEEKWKNEYSFKVYCIEIKLKVDANIRAIIVKAILDYSWLFFFCNQNKNVCLSFYICEFQDIYAHIQEISS